MSQQNIRTSTRKRKATNRYGTYAPLDDIHCNTIHTSSSFNDEEGNKKPSVFNIFKKNSKASSSKAKSNSSVEEASLSPIHTIAKVVRNVVTKKKKQKKMDYGNDSVVDPINYSETDNMIPNEKSKRISSRKRTATNRYGTYAKPLEDVDRNTSHNADDNDSTKSSIFNETKRKSRKKSKQKQRSMPPKTVVAKKLLSSNADDLEMVSGVDSSNHDSIVDSVNSKDSDASIPSKEKEVENCPGPPMPESGNYSIPIKDQFDRQPRKPTENSIGRRPIQEICKWLQDWSRTRPLAKSQWETEMTMTKKESKAFLRYENEYNRSNGHDAEKLEAQLGHPCPVTRRQVKIVEEVEDEKNESDVLSIPIPGTAGKTHVFDIVIKPGTLKRLKENRGYTTYGFGSGGRGDIIFNVDGENFGLWTEFLLEYPKFYDQNLENANKFLAKREANGVDVQITGNDLIKKITLSRRDGTWGELGVRKLSKVEVAFIRDCNTHFLLI